MITTYGNLHPFNPSYMESMMKLYHYNNIDQIDDLPRLIPIKQNIQLAFFDINIHNPKYDDVKTNLNHTNLLFKLLVCLKSMTKDANMLIIVPALNTKFSQDIIHLLTTLFQKVALTLPEIQEPFKHFNVIILKGFKGCPDTIIEKLEKCYKEMYINDNTGGKKYYPSDKEAIKIFNLKVNEKETKIPYKYWNSLLDTSSPQYKKNQQIMNNYSNLFLQAYNDFLNKLIFYYQNYSLDGEKMKRYKLINLNTSIMMANSLGLKINPLLDTRSIQDDFINNIYQNLYSLDNTVYYKFRKYEAKLKISNLKMEESFPSLLKKVLQMEKATRIFDTRHFNKSDYDVLKKKLRFYEKSLNKMLMEKVNNGIPKKGEVVPPSRAWIKMYEIMELAHLVSKKKEKLKVLFFCEAPGNFVMGMNHFLKTKTNVSDFDWVAQSYNPDNKNKNFNAFGDDYGLMASYPDRWDFGPKNSGDITDPDNIKYYGEVYNDRDLMVSDCGRDWGTNVDEDSKLMYAQLLFVLANLPEGKSFVIKYYVPHVHFPAQLSLFYIIYQCFDEISFYKPLQNAWSPEFYLIGKKYRHKLTYKQLEPLLENLDNFNPYKTSIPLNTIPETFIRQMEVAVDEVSSRFIFYIERYIYYLDMIEFGQKPNYQIIQDHIETRNKEWMKTFKIERINTKDKLL